MAHGLSVAALDNPHQVTLPLQHAGSDDEAGALNLPGEIEEDWSQRMAAALEVARLGCKICPSDLWDSACVVRQYSGFSKFHETYPPLFEELWDAWRFAVISLQVWVGLA